MVSVDGLVQAEQLQRILVIKACSSEDWVKAASSHCSRKLSPPNKSVQSPTKFSRLHCRNILALRSQSWLDPCKIVRLQLSSVMACVLMQPVQHNAHIPTHSLLTDNHATSNSSPIMCARLAAQSSLGSASMVLPPW